MASNAKTVRKEAFRVFKINQLSLSKPVLKCILEYFTAFPDYDKGQVQMVISDIANKIKSKKLGSVVSKQIVEEILEELGANLDEDLENTLMVIDAFKYRRFKFNKVRGNFLPSEVKSVLGSAEAKCALGIDRFESICQRLDRHKFFQAPALHERRHKTAYRPVTPDILSFDSKEPQCLMGALFEDREGNPVVDGPRGQVRIAFEEDCDYNAGFFTMCSFVLCEGVYDTNKDAFMVSAISTLPIERRRRTLQDYPVLDFMPVEEAERRAQLERENDDEMFVFVSHVYLDDPNVFDALRGMFNGYSSGPPKLFIFSGNFTQQRFRHKIEDLMKLKGYFTKLGSLISEFESLMETSRFIFIPGPADPVMGNVLPIPQLPEFLTTGLRRKLKERAVFATNPCRIHYMTQEIVIFRADLMQKLRRNCVVPPNLEKYPELSKHLATTVLSQAHLCPLPLLVQPRYWEYDHALGLYPIPDLLVVADSQAAFSTKEAECLVLNPGDFSQNFEFSVYYPAHRKSQSCQIPRNLLQS